MPQLDKYAVLVLLCWFVPTIVVMFLLNYFVYLPRILSFQLYRRLKLHNPGSSVFTGAVTSDFSLDNLKQFSFQSSSELLSQTANNQRSFLSDNRISNFNSAYKNTRFSSLIAFYKLFK